MYLVNIKEKNLCSRCFLWRIELNWRFYRWVLSPKISFFFEVPVRHQTLALGLTTFQKRQVSTLYPQTFFLGTSRPECCDVPLALTFRLVRYSWRSEAMPTSGDCEAEGRRACRWSFCLSLPFRLHYILCWHVEISSWGTLFSPSLLKVKQAAMKADVTVWC